jgi:hypothetical protein
MRRSLEGQYAQQRPYASVSSRHERPSLSKKFDGGMVRKNARRNI